MDASRLVVVLLMGCGPARLPGAPDVGKACASGSLAECTTTSDVAYCQDGKWVEYECARCSNAQPLRCEGRVSGAVLDTACHVEGGTACIGDALVVCKRRTLPIDSQYAWSPERDCPAGRCSELPGDRFIAVCL